MDLCGSGALAQLSPLYSTRLLFVSRSDIDLDVSGFSSHFVFILSSSALWAAGSVCSALV